MDPYGVRGLTAHAEMSASGIHRPWLGYASGVAELDGRLRGRVKRDGGFVAGACSSRQPGTACGARYRVRMRARVASPTGAVADQRESAWRCGWIVQD